VRPQKPYSILVCCLLFCSRLVASDPQWIEVRSPNFSVITDAGDKKGRDVALHFEQMRSVFGALLTSAKVNLSVPLQIVAFRNTKEMRQVAPIFNGKPTELAGLFQGGEDRSFIMLDMSVDNPWSVVFHEYAHRLMDGNLTFRTDPWFEEGFAEYFSSIEVDNKEARVGKVPEQTYQILQQLGMVKVSDLFRVQQYTKTYNESGDHRTTFYAESGLVVHYLYDNLLVQKLSVYFDALQLEKKPVEQALQAAFGMTPEQFDKTLRNYLSSGRYRYYPIPTPAGIVAAQFTVTPVTGADSRALVADIHAHSPDYRSKALGEFQEVLKSDPDNLSALRGAGFSCLQQKDFEHAADYLERAAQRDSKDARVHFYYAMLLNQQGLRDAGKSEKIKKELETSIALDPTFADAYSLLGYTQAVSGEGDKGIATMKKALQLSPRNEHYMFNLASVCMTNRKVDDAIAILRKLTGSGDPEMAMRARQSLEQAVDFKERSTMAQTQVPGLSIRGVAASEQPSDSKPAELPPPAPLPMHFLKGTLVAVECFSPPQAVLVVSSGSKMLRLAIHDTGHVVLIGADQFSCDWKGKKVAVNYRQRADSEGDVASLEIQ
jgi:tetratricopeptide (TPR) repeat protein